MLMCNAPKKVSKSIRLTEDLYKYIDNYRGEGFNEKFENVILDARDSEQKRRIRLGVLQKDYDGLYAKYVTLQQSFAKLNSIHRNAVNVHRMLYELSGECKEFLHPAESD